MDYIEDSSFIVMGKLMPTQDALDLVPDHPYPAEIVPSVGAKACYDAHGKDGRSVKANVEKAVENQHLSVVEHMVVSIFIEGISRGLSHELVRHRHFSFSQRSTRYVDESVKRVVLEPRVLELRETQPMAFQTYIAALGEAFIFYDGAVGDFMELAREHHPGTEVEMRKFARGAARQLLPTAVETQMVVTGNLRTWREVLLLRSERYAEAEIRRLMHNLWHGFFKGLAPSVFSDFKEREVDGFTELYRVDGKDALLARAGIDINALLVENANLQTQLGTLTGRKS